MKWVCQQCGYTVEREGYTEICSQCWQSSMKEEAERETTKNQKEE